MGALVSFKGTGEKMPLRSKERELRWVITFFSPLHLSRKSQGKQRWGDKMHCELGAEEGPWAQGECVVPAIVFSPP